MRNFHCFTSASLAYLDRALVLLETLKETHPDWVVWLCLVDEAPEGFDLDRGLSAFDHVITIRDLDIDNFERWSFKHNVIELCTAVKGFALSYIFKQGAEHVVYLDPDIAVFNPLTPVLEGFKSSSILLTPHLLRPESSKPAAWDTERSALRHGVYNLGFLGVKNDAVGRRFAEWWQTRLSWFCFEMASDGVYTDQRWCDLIPAFFSDVGILRDPGLNVASWNIRNRAVCFDNSGQLFVDGGLLRFFHFTKISHAGELEIVKNAGKHLAPLHLMRWYREKLKQKKPRDIPKNWWHFANYSDGSIIPYSHREIYRSHLDLQVTFPHPYTAGTFDAWMAQHGSERQPDIPSLGMEDC